MALTAVLFWVSLVIAVIGSDASSGELAVLHRPDSLHFTETSTVKESVLKEIYSASLGLSVEETAEWDGLLIKDPFSLPEAVVTVSIDGLPSLGMAAQLKGPKYFLIVDEYEPDTFDDLKRRIKQRFPDGNNNLVNINLSNMDESYSDIFGLLNVPKLQKQTYQHLKTTVAEDNKFLLELASLEALIKNVQSGAITPNAYIDVYNFRLRSLHALSDFHGPNSLQVKEAKKLLGEVLENLTNAYVNAYDGSVLVTVVSTDVAHTRVTRSAADTATRRSNLSSYPEDYAAIFNIMLWFGVVFVFTLIAIVYSLIDMDPGRDSIIYRMTSTRMKKDN